MIPEKNLKFLNLLFISLSAIVLSILTYNANGSPFRFNIDPSWHFALNYFFNQRLQLGSQVHFTYGPFGFLIFSLPLGNNLLIASWFWFISRCILAVLLIQLIMRPQVKTNLNHLLLTSMGLILFLCLINVHLLFFLNVALILMFNRDKKNIYYLLLSCFTAVLSFLIKPGLGIYNFLALYIYFSLLRNWRYLVLITLANILLYFGLWLAYYQNLSGSIGFLHSSWEFATGFNQAMGITQPNSLTYILLSLVFLILSSLAFFKRPLFANNGLIAYLLVLPAILLCYKFSYTREDQHIYLILNFVILSYLFWWLLLDAWPSRILLSSCGILCCLFLYANQLRVGYPVLPLQAHLGFTNFYQEIIQAKQFKAKLIDQSQKNFNRIDLPLEKFLDLTNNSFDIYPYNAALIPAKNLKWQPRPIMQSYTSYTAYLDNLNAEYINHQRGADYIIWHDADTFREIDQRYLLNSEPNTSFAILNNYAPILAYNSYVVLKKRDKPVFSLPQIFSQQKTNFNQWLTIPKNNYPLVRAKIFLHQNIHQKFQNLFYTPQVTIDYLLSNQTIISYPLIVATAKNGIWIKPFLQSLTNSLTKINLAAYPGIPNQHVNYQLNKAKFSSGFLLLSGWALVKNFNPQTTQVTILLANDKQAFAFKPEPHTRSDVIAKFPAIIANPQYSGFLAKLNLAAIPSGNYHLYLQMIYDNKPGIFGPLTSFNIGDREKQSSETVTAIRLRHDSAAYDKEIIIQWMGGKIL